MDSPFLGQIQSFGFNFAPRGWQLCNGQTMSISQNTALFSLLGTVYGGNGVQTFMLPNLQGRIPVGQGNGIGLTPRVIGETGGTENVSIGINNMPAHMHGLPAPTINVSALAGTQTVPGTAGANTLGAIAPTTRGGSVSNAYVADPAPAVNLVTGSTGGTSLPIGGSLPISVMQPYLVINYSIAISGMFPSRN